MKHFNALFSFLTLGFTLNALGCSPLVIGQAISCLGFAFLTIDSIVRENRK